MRVLLFVLLQSLRAQLLKITIILGETQHEANEKKKEKRQCLKKKKKKKHISKAVTNWDKLPTTNNW